jgi:hypothetical protein
MTTGLQLRDYLDDTSNTELGMFIKSTGKKTTQMRYDEFVKHALERFKPLVQEYIASVDEHLKACQSLKEIEELKIPALPDNIREEIIAHMDKQKGYDIVEQTYLCLDLVRAVTSQIGSVVGKAAMHYGNAFKAVNNLNGSGGGKIIGLNGRPLR